MGLDVQIEFSSSDLALLNTYLQKVEKKIGYLAFEDRQKIIESVKQFLAAEVTEQRSLNEVLLQYRDQHILINMALAKHGMPSLPPHGRRWWKILIMLFLSFMLIGILLLVFTIKSFLPLVNVNDVDGTLELFGKHFILEKDDADFFQKLNDKHFMSWKNTAVISKGSFDFSNTSLPLAIDIKRGELAIRHSNSVEMKYRCFTEKMVGKLFTQVDHSIVMNLSEKAYCLLFLPKGLSLKVKINQGIINLKNIEQNISIEMGSGIVSWKQNNWEDFYLQRLEATHIQGEQDQFSPHGQWIVNIVVHDGEVRLR